MTHPQWQAVREAVPRVGARFAGLLASVPDPGVRAAGEWTVAEAGAHVGMIALMYTGMVRGDDGPLPLPGLADAIRAVSVDTLAGMNALALELYPERDPRRLGQRLRADLDEVLLVSADLDPAKPVPWLGGSRVPVAGLLAHLLNEMLVHGLDIARATGRPWSIASWDEALFLELFLFGMIRHDLGCLLDHARPSTRRIAVEFRSAYTATVVLVLRHGTLTLEAPDGRPDVRLTFDPAVLVPMLFGRHGKLHALRNGLRVGGRRPWLLPEFLRTLRMP